MTNFHWSVLEWCISLIIGDKRSKYKWKYNNEGNCWNYYTWRYYRRNYLWRNCWRNWQICWKQKYVQYHGLMGTIFPDTISWIHFPNSISWILFSDQISWIFSRPNFLGSFSRLNFLESFFRPNFLDSFSRFPGIIIIFSSNPKRKTWKNGSSIYWKYEELSKSSRYKQS